MVRGLGELGHEVVQVRPHPGLPLPGSGSLAGRIAFNVSLPLRLDPDAFDLVVGFDLDGFLLPRHGSTPVVVCLKGVAADEAVFESGWGRMGRRVAAALEGRSARTADVVVVPSRYSAGRARRAYGLDPGCLAVVPEGIDLSPWRAARAEVSCPAWEREPVILNVARQYRRKNTGALLAALPGVRRRVPGARLRIVGGGPELPALRRLARATGMEEAVTFLGAVESDAAVRREYLTAACFCLPSRQEGFGIVLLEAMAAGLPIVAADAGALPEVAPPDRAGLLVDPEDPEELARALVRILTRKGLARRLAEEGERRVAGYGITAVADRFVDEVLRRLDPAAPPR